MSTNINKLNSSINTIQPERSGGIEKSQSGLPGLDFKDVLREQFNPETTELKSQTQNSAVTDGVKFSQHAVDRMMSRGISFNNQDISKLNDAIQRAEGKGGKDTLVLMNDAALIVSVKNKTVVTVMDKNALKENVFTNIDSTIVM
jgi:flagellar operon protein